MMGHDELERIRDLREMIGLVERLDSLIRKSIR
ncbi:hypothetical protein NVP1032O_40 [Vibrio phage 1.032.O._10N.261.54.F5]|nr:hypothetical protein NVP1032O_40 [Vibrio phage 1.032.O._10N.261.54.F5]